MFGPLVPSTSITFVSGASLKSNAISRLGLRKRVEAVRGCRAVSKRDMRFNDAMPRMSVDPESYRVEADGLHCVAEPAESLPLSQAYFVF
jgi:urease